MLVIKEQRSKSTDSICPFENHYSWCMTVSLENIPFIFKPTSADIPSETREIAYFKRAKRVLLAKFGQSFVVMQKERNMLLRQLQAAVVQLWCAAAVLPAVCGGDGFISAEQAQTYQQQHSPSSHMEGTTLALSTYNHLWERQSERERHGETERAQECLEKENERFTGEDKHQSSGSNHSVGTWKRTDLTPCGTPTTGNISDLFPSIV